MLSGECRTVEERVERLSSEIRERVMERERIENLLKTDKQNASTLEARLNELAQESTWVGRILNRFKRRTPGAIPGASDQGE